MKLTSIVCVFRGHNWSRWKTKQPTITRPTGGYPYGQSITADPNRAPYGERQCKRCGKLRHGAAPRPRTRATRKANLRAYAEAEGMAQKLTPIRTAEEFGKAPRAEETMHAEFDTRTAGEKK